MDAEIASEQLWVELLLLADGEWSDEEIDRIHEVIHVLNRRGVPTVVDWALPLLGDASGERRQMAAMVLGQHGFRLGRPFAEQIYPAIARAARVEADADVREMMVTALGHAEDPAWVPEMLTYVSDPDPDVREVVAGSLPMLFAGEEPTAEVVEALITLSQDEKAHVRDWATFSLGTLCDLDTPQIRAALRARLDDDDEADDAATTGEAAVGLARRHDPVVYPYLDRWLALPVDVVANLPVEAAGATGDPRFLPRLLELRDAGWQDYDPLPEILDEAITALERAKTETEGPDHSS